MRTTPGRFRTRVITEGVVSSLHVDYKHSKIKQYHKEGCALRTETIISDTRDFEIGRRPENLSALRKVGFTSNRRLLNDQRISHDCSLGDDAFNDIHSPVQRRATSRSLLKLSGGSRPSTQLFLDRQS